MKSPAKCRRPGGAKSTHDHVGAMAPGKRLEREPRPHQKPSTVGPLSQPVARYPFLSPYAPNLTSEHRTQEHDRARVSEVSNIGASSLSLRGRLPMKSPAKCRRPGGAKSTHDHVGAMAPGKGSKGSQGHIRSLVRSAP